MHERAFSFTVHPTSGVPIYRQIMDQATALIASGRLKEGDMLPSIRQLAETLEVNMMTVSKAYQQLEAEGALTRVRGRGMAVAPQKSEGTASLKCRQQELRPLVEQAVVRGRQLNLTDRQITAVLEAILGELRE